MPFEEITETRLVHIGPVDSSETFTIVLADGEELVCIATSFHHLHSPFALDPAHWPESVKEAAAKVRAMLEDSQRTKELVAHFTTRLVIGHEVHINVRVVGLDRPHASVAFAAPIARFKVPTSAIAPSA